MLKIKDIFRKKNKNKYKVGDTVFLIGYPTSNFKTKGKELKLFKMKITEIIEDKEGMTYKTNMRTGLEYKNGGYNRFDDLDTIKEAINEFCDKSFMDWECAEDERQNV